MKFNNIFNTAAAMALVALGFQSCSMDEPFADRGDASLTLTTDIRGDVVKTRAMDADELAALREKCVVYIENSKGIIRKWKGLDNIPQQVRLRVGQYVAEAWSGDSVSASYDSKFYRGWQQFEVAEGNNSLTLHCNIANVITSVDPSALELGLTDLKIKYSHSRGELDFNEDNIATAKGYFMMPNADKDLNYVVTATKDDGSEFRMEGKIQNVQRAHEYVMYLSKEDHPVNEGGVLIRLKIVDIPVIDEEVEVFSAPAVQGIGFNIEDQVVSIDRNFTDTRVYVRGYFGLGSVLMSGSDNFTDLPSGNILSQDVGAALAAKGINVELRKSKDAAPSLDAGEVDVDELYITFTKAFLDALPESDKEYTISFDATDGRHYESKGALRIANSDAAVEHLAPVGAAPAPDPVSDPMAILATSATVQGRIYDAAAAANFGIEYREAGTENWTKAYPTAGASKAARRVARARVASGAVTRAAATPYSVTLSGLKPGTTYEYRAFCDNFVSETIETFSTEAAFVIPGASFEEWSTYSAKTMLGQRTVILPWAVGDKLASFWGSGNEGAATANKVLTDKSEDMKHGGTYSARLASNAAMGIIAAGNIFVGHYVETDVTNGVLSLGREYNGSHPSKLRVWANYRPGGNVSIGKNDDVKVLTAGGTDHGQIYVALTDEPIEIRTNPDKRKLFDPEDTHVLAYGQVTWTENFGPDGQLAKLEIPIVYNDRAKTTRPRYLVIVASASKYGDYFSGSSSSVMYLDDFELVYE